MTLELLADGELRSTWRSRINSLIHRRFDTLADMFAMASPVDGEVYEVLGYETPGDAGESKLFIYDEGNSDPVDGGLVMPGAGGSLAFTNTTGVSVSGSNTTIQLDGTASNDDNAYNGKFITVRWDNETARTVPELTYDGTTKILTVFSFGSIKSDLDEDIVVTAGLAYSIDDQAFTGDEGTGRFLAIDTTETTVDWFGAVGDDANDVHGPITRALNSQASIINLRSKTYRMTQPLLLIGNKTIRGKGESSILTCVTKGITIIRSISNTGVSNIALENFVVDGGEENFTDYFAGGGFGVLLGTGQGWDGDQTDVLVQNMIIQRCQVGGIDNYGGIKRLRFLNNIVRRNGRGNTFHRIRYSEFVGNQFEDVGDDAIACHNDGNNITITGNTFYRVRGNVTSSGAGVKISGGTNIAVTGNSFHECFSGVYITHSTGNSDANSYGCASNVTVSGNTFIFQTPDDIQDNRTPYAVRLKSANNISLSDNIYMSVQTDGVPGGCVDIGDAYNITFSNDKFMGGKVVFQDYVNEILFQNCLFHPWFWDDTNMEEEAPIHIDLGRRVENLRLRNCGFARYLPALVSLTDGSDAGLIEIEGAYPVEPIQIAYPDGELTGVLTTFDISRYYEDNDVDVYDNYNGTRVKAVSGQTLVVNNQDQDQEEITLSGDFVPGDDSISINSWTPSGSFLDGVGWIEWTTSWTPAERSYVVAVTAGSTVDKLIIKRSQMTTLENNSTGAGTVTDTETDYASGSGTPVSIVTPHYIGEEYFDTDGTWYKATGLTNADWVALN